MNSKNSFVFRGCLMPKKIGTDHSLPFFNLPSTGNFQTTPILHQIHGDSQVFRLNQNHYQELLNSGIDPEIIALNFQSIEGTVTHEYLLSDALAKLGDGKQTPHTSQYVTSEVARYFRVYNHTLAGGWWCSGIDLLNNCAPMDWGCFKPDFPRLDSKKNRPIKYEHPPGIATRAFFLRGFSPLAGIRYSETPPSET
jgi:hypothetical protein